ncbi:hypothetical protein BH20ACI1_BH20ACI1_05740 [soil metagenome]
MNLSKSLCVSLFLILFLVGFAGNSFSQDRTRIVPNEQPENPAQSPPTQRRPTLTNQINVQTPAPLIKKSTSSQPINAPSNINVSQPPLVKKTGSSQPINASSNSYVSKYSYSPVFSQRLLLSIQNKFGIPYRYGSEGPRTYDCSGLVWSVFKEAGYYFDRTSARTLWQESEMVEGDDRFKLGTLVFFNKLGHIGIVADSEGFYHASSSQGVTYSKFEGYWKNRIVGFRRLPLNAIPYQPSEIVGSDSK